VFEKRAGPLVVVETHPIQYHAPVYRMLEEKFSVSVTAIYESDFSVAGYRDAEFGSTFSWDTDLLEGYHSVFLSRSANGVPRGATSAPGLAKALSEANPSAVLLVGYSPAFHQKAFYYAWRFALPILFRGETTDHARTRSPLKQWARKSALHWLYGQCSRLLYVGRRSNEHFRGLGCPEEKLVFAPYCVDTTPFRFSEEARADLRAAMRRKLQIKESEIVLLFSGKLSARKGPDLLVNALKSLDRDLRERTIVLFLGSGVMEETLKALAARVPLVRTHFAGFQNQTHLSPYYHAADLLALPSRHSETWGLVVNEALHHGVPCVVSEAVGCAPDLVWPGSTGEISETDSAESLAAALKRALALVGRPEIRSRCRERVSGYTVEKAAEGIAQAYRDVLH
jgi:glycosyltransferase involved in cell wall biosynthesis